MNSLLCVQAVRYASAGFLYHTGRPDREQPHEDPQHASAYHAAAPELHDSPTAMMGRNPELIPLTAETLSQNHAPV